MARPISDVANKTTSPILQFRRYTEPMQNAFGYLRVSGKSQIDGDGFPRQREAIRRFAAAHGYHIGQWFTERAVTGKTEWAERPAWAEMVAKLNGTKVIIIEKLDRLARDLMVQEHIIADLRHRGISLISVAEPDLCVDDPSRKLLRQIMGAIAEYDRVMIVMKLKAARHRMRESEGRCEGQKPYGTLDGEAAILSRMQLLRSAGEPYHVIATTLNTDGMRPRKGDQWHAQTVNKILRRAK